MIAPAARVGGYEVLRELGRGGMATVHLARQVDLDRLVALKRLDGLADESDVRVRRFVREARLAASLSHPNIVTVHDAFEVDGVPYIAMELVPGGTLRELLTGLTLEQIAGVLDGVLAGLAHAERRHIVHRDLKPENLMVTAEGGIKITDFGIAKATSVAHGDDGPLTTAGVAIGTPAYMAPEQALAEEAGARTDLYAVGVIAFEMLTGRVPFEDRESPMRVLMQHVNEQPPSVAELRPRVDPELSQWVAALLAKAPSDRPASAAATQERLEDIVLRLRGGRWRREAPLPFVAGAAPAPAAPLAAPGLLSDERTRAARRTPPTPPVRDDTAALASPRGARRVPRAVTMALVAGVAAAAIAAGANGVGGGVGAGGAPPAVQVSQAESSASPVAGPAAAAASPAATPAAVEPAPGTIDPSRVVDAERESRRFAEEAQDTEGDGDETLTQQLRDTQYAYRDAAAAAAAGDMGRFTTTLAKADALARTALARLDGDSGDESDGDSGGDDGGRESADDGGDDGGNERSADVGDDEGGADENADDGGDEGGGA